MRPHRIDESAGELPVIWTFDVANGDPSTGQTIALYIGDRLVGEDSQDLDADWTGSNGGAFAVASTSFAAGGGNTALADGIDFASGSINFAKGLQYFPDQLFIGNGTEPNPGDSSLVITAVELSGADMVSLTFASTGGASYSIEASADLASAFVELAAASGAEGAATTTIAVPRDGLAKRFFRVRLR